jgi:hypothetical protein
MVVREHEILRVAASIGGKDSNKAADTARREILKWAEKRCGGHNPKVTAFCRPDGGLIVVNGCLLL